MLTSLTLFLVCLVGLFRVSFNTFQKWIESRIKKNKNAIISVNGPTGSGKSYVCLTRAKEDADLFGTNFTIADNVAFKFDDLLKKTMLPQNQKPGTPFTFEETGAVGSGASAREWQKQANKFFLSFLQTTRCKNQILYFNCPHFAFLEKGARILCHAQLEMKGINFRTRKALVKPYLIQVNSRTGKMYFKYLRFKYNNKRMKFTQMIVDHPPDDLAKEYEEVKAKFIQKHNQSILDSGKEEKKPKERSKVNHDKLQKLIDKGISQGEIAKIFGVTRRTIVRHIREVRQKSHSLKVRQKSHSKY